MAYLANLTNPVHPAFSKEKFPKYVEYDEVLLQPARLASLLIQTPQDVHYFLAIIHDADHPSEFENTLGDKSRRTYHELKQILELRPSDFTRVERELEQVAETLLWDFQNLNINDYAETRLKLSVDASDPNSLSARSIVVINQDFYVAIAQATKSVKLLRLQFLLGVTMAHELSHATWYALTTMVSTDCEPVFGPSGSGEAGDELEARLFGFRAAEEDKLSGKIKWFKLVTFQDGQNQGAERPVGRVHIDFIQRLFADWFWQHYFSTKHAWTIIPSLAWSPEMSVPSSISALIHSTTTFTPPGPIAEVKEIFKKRKRSDDDDEDK